ncbi:MAG: hypothetical protein HZA54_12980, partial [Planctomycetes bacterium]|nr:hypothetical protein [Planctomycetota bacterium]
MAEATKKRSLCKACGAAMEIAPGSAVITWSGCGKKYKLPAKPGESSKPAAAAAAVAAKPPASSGARRAAAVAAPAARPTEAPDADENGGGDADAAGEEAAGAPAVAAKGADGAASKGDKAAAINAAASKRMRRVAASFGIDAPKEGEVPVSDEEKAVAEKKSLKKKLVAILTILILTPIFVGIAVYQRLRQPEPAKPKPPEERTIIQRDFKKDLKDCEKLRDEAWECRKVAMIELRDDLPAKEAKLKEGIAAAERAKKILADAIDSVKNEPDRATNYAYLDDAMKESEAVCKSLTEILTTKPVEPEKPKAGVPMPDKKDPEKKDGDKKD